MLRHWSPIRGVLQLIPDGYKAKWYMKVKIPSNWRREERMNHKENKNNKWARENGTDVAPISLHTFKSHQTNMCLCVWVCVWSYESTEWLFYTSLPLEKNVFMFSSFCLHMIRDFSSKPLSEPNMSVWSHLLLIWESSHLWFIQHGKGFV